MKLRTNRGRMTSFNAISLTDIVFLLLIFFLLSSTFVLQPGIKVALPRTTTVEVSTEKSIVVTIAADGSLYLNDEKVSRATLPGQLRVKLQSIGRPIVVIRADRRVSLEQTVDVMDMAKQAGAEKFMIATREKE
ncbi:MAG: biopolymer transporter ExbD [Candidatus Latescibacterota bacterium]